MKNNKNNQAGFTLVELLVVIGILAVLLTIVLIAINPARQFGQANDTKRRSDVNAIINAVGAYASDNAGQLPASITTTATEIKKPGGIDICADLVSKYISALPSDPKNAPITDCPASYATGYSIIKDATTNRITVSATPEIATSISVTR